MEPRSFSYREVIPNYICDEQWLEISLNIGTAQSTLQDIKIAERAGGYCYKNLTKNHNRNRYIYWRTYQDVLELTEISLDYNLHQNNFRLKFIDAPVLAVSISEKERHVVLLVVTACSLHYIAFTHPDTMVQDSCPVHTSEMFGISLNSFSDVKYFSIFHNVNASTINNPNSFYVIETVNGSPNNAMPHAANCFMSTSREEAYYALACESNLILFIMHCETGNITEYLLKEHQMMPRLLSNLKDVLTGKSDTADSDCATGLEFVINNEQIYLLALYRNDDLRIWSTSSQLSIYSINCNREGLKQRQQGPQSNALRKVSDTRVCAFLSHSCSSEFVCIDVNANLSNAAVSLVHRKIISALPLDLTDFDVSESRIWALWSNAEGEFSVSNFSLDHGMGMNWITAAMEPPPDRYGIGIEQGMDPREAYCSYIFHPGKFDRDVISKALFMFRRSSVRFDTKNCSLSLLKDHVYAAVEEEIQNEVKDFNVTDEEYVEISTRLWERFYTCCEQYHMKNSQPTGLFILPTIDAVCLIKKNNYSLLRPCESLEHLMLAGDDADIDVIVPLQFSGNEQIGSDLVHLIAILAQIEKWLPEDVKIEMDKKLYRLEMPNVLIQNTTDEILSGDPDKEILPKNFMVLLCQKLQSISDLRMSMSLLLDSLRIDNGNPEAMQAQINVLYSSRLFSKIGNLFGSDVGLSLMSETVRQTAMIRFAICRNLLIFQQILIDTHSLPIEISETIRSQFMPDVSIFLLSYYAMVWIAEKPIYINQLAIHEAAKTRLGSLKLINFSEHVTSNENKNQFTSLLQLFLKAKGLHTAIALCAESLKALKNVSWQLTLLPLNTIISQLIWPVSFNFVFGEWLFGTCQHIIIEDYVRLLNNWCEWNICSRQFMLASSLLDCGDSQKAYDLFLQSAKGILKEHFLSIKILKNTQIGEQLKFSEKQKSEEQAITISNRAIAQYYLKVIQLFEQHNALDHIISLAKVAIGLLEQDDSQLPMFQSIVFNNHLQLEHYEEAYHSLIHNAELSRRKDCLRQLVVTLFQRKRFDLLIHFPYINLHEEFEKIVESKARSLPIDQNEIYDFLYAFHINNGNMRKASAVMYEQSMRLKMETDSIESMRSRKNSLLVCLNALHLIDERYRWIAKPVLSDENGNNDTQNEFSITKKVIVLEIKDIRRELLQTESLLRLADHRKDAQTFLNAGAQELVFIMATSGLFTDAIKLAEGFEISLLPIFDCLTAFCVHTSEENSNEILAWLQQNDLADLPHRNKCSDIAYSLLQKLVEDNELPNSSQIRKIVVIKLCSLNAFIPQWLSNGYKLTNSAELLHLLVKHNRFLDASALAAEILNAMVGVGSEYFSFKHPIAVTSPDMWLPINTLDLLMLGLKKNSQDDIEYKQAITELEELLEKYFNIAQRTAADKMSFQLNRIYNPKMRNY